MDSLQESLNDIFKNTTKPKRKRKINSKNALSISNYFKPIVVIDNKDNDNTTEQPMEIDVDEGEEGNLNKILNSQKNFESDPDPAGNVVVDQVNHSGFFIKRKKINLNENENNKFEFEGKGEDEDDDMSFFDSDNDNCSEEEDENEDEDEEENVNKIMIKKRMDYCTEILKKWNELHSFFIQFPLPTPIENQPLQVVFKERMKEIWPKLHKDYVDNSAFYENMMTIEKKVNSINVKRRKLKPGLSVCIIYMKTARNSYGRSTGIKQRKDKNYAGECIYTQTQRSFFYSFKF